MKKLFIGLIIGLCYGSINAGTVYEEGPNNVKATITNAISPWFVTNADNVGLAIYVTAGTCKVEISSDFPKYCKDDTATPFDWDAAPVTAGNKQFLSYTSGLSCVRANCSSGTGVFTVRKH
jgi:hypothetical protein